MPLSELDASDSSYGPLSVSCEQDHELSCFTQGGKFLHKLINYQLFKEDSVIRSRVAS